jgi:E3 ubiquitin-protein ligase MARCH6
MFVHWLLGMLYVFYFASFVLVMRDVLRPGTLWFLRNLNDPDFNPIQEMLTLPVARHLRRLLASTVRWN